MESTPAATLLRIFMDDPVSVERSEGPAIRWRAHPPQAMIVEGKRSIRSPLTQRQAAVSAEF